MTVRFAYCTKKYFRTVQRKLGTGVMKRAAQEQDYRNSGGHKRKQNKTNSCKALCKLDQGQAAQSAKHCKKNILGHPRFLGLCWTPPKNKFVGPPPQTKHHPLAARHRTTALGEGGAGTCAGQSPANDFLPGANFDSTWMTRCSGEILDLAIHFQHYVRIPLTKP